MRARIYLRKQGLALTADQRDESVESAMQMLKAEKEENISAHDVLDALRRGDEVCHLPFLMKLCLLNSLRSLFFTLGWSSLHTTSSLRMI